MTRKASWGGRTGVTIGGLALLALLLVPGTRAEDPGPWLAFQPPRDDFAPTILDLSHLVTGPTGRHGFVRVEKERFVFEDGTPARFWGAELGLFEKREIDYAAKRLRKLGVNLVRLHGLEALNDAQGRSILDYDAEAFDKLDYTVYRLGEEGIHLALNADYPLVVRFGVDDGIPGLPQGGPAPFAEFFNPKVARLKAQRLRDVFGHRNPYTGKRYCDDPTLALIEIVNEDSLFWYALDSMGEPLRGELEMAFGDWLLKRYKDAAGLSKAWSYGGRTTLAANEGGPGQRVTLLPISDFTEETFAREPIKRRRGQDQMRFYLDLEERFWEASRQTLREVGVRVPIAATNWMGGGLTTRVHLYGQSKLDYVDRHGYWDHPEGEGDLKWRIASCLFHNLPMVKETAASSRAPLAMGVGNLVIAKSWEQVLGKPTSVSEWNTCLPNEHSLEGPGLMAAYGSLQGWDSLVQFGYLSPRWSLGLSSGSFDMLGNPPQILQLPAVAAMWHRQDVKEAPIVAEALYGFEDLFELVSDKRPVGLDVALIGRVGYRFTPSARVGEVLDVARYWSAKTRTARSITEELTWGADEGLVTVDTARTQALIGFIGGPERRLANVMLATPTRFGAVYVTAMDGEKPISSARRLLVTAVGPARNTGMEYEQTAQAVPQRDATFWRLKSEGRSPTLLEAVVGELRVRNVNAASLKAWALDFVGKRREELPLRVDPGFVSLRLGPEQRAVDYELALE